MYANDASGFAVGFSVAKLQEYCRKYREDKSVEVRLEPVIYSKEEQDDLIEKTIQSLFENEPKDHKGKVENKATLDPLWWLYEKIWKMAAVCKNPSFLQEKEQRIVMMPNRREDKNTGHTIADIGISELIFEKKGNRIVPHYDFEFEPAAVTDIRSGPRNFSREKNALIKDLLRANGYQWNHIGPIPSEIPYQSKGSP